MTIQSYPSISLGSNNWLSTLTLDEFDITNRVDPNIKRYQMYEVNEDALALSVTWKRLRDEKRSVTCRLLDGTLFQDVTQADRDMASIISDYYSKKIMMVKLKSNQPLSKYREDLNTFIHGNHSIIREDMIGLIYRLPDFYNFDIALDANTAKVNKKAQLNPKISSSAKFEPLGKLDRKTKNRHVIQYWMREKLTGNAAMIAIDAKNPLQNVWEMLFDNSEALTLTYSNSIQHLSDNSIQHLSDTEYMLLSKWNLTKF